MAVRRDWSSWGCRGLAINY